MNLDLRWPLSASSKVSQGGGQQTTLKVRARVRIPQLLHSAVALQMKPLDNPSIPPLSRRFDHGSCLPIAGSLLVDSSRP